MREKAQIACPALIRFFLRLRSYIIYKYRYISPRPPQPEALCAIYITVHPLSTRSLYNNGRGREEGEDLTRFIVVIYSMVAICIYSRVYGDITRAYCLR